MFQSRPLLFVALVTVFAMLIAANLQAEEKKLEPVLASVVTKAGVTVRLDPARKVFVVKAADGKTAVDAAGARFALLPVLAKQNPTLQSMGIVTFAPMKGDMPATWPNLSDVANFKKQHFETAMQFTFKPIWEESVCKGYELVALAAKKAPESEEEVTPARREDEPRTIERVSTKILLPKEVSKDRWYGVMLHPVWNKDGKTLKGFDLMLVSTPLKKLKMGK